MKPARERFPPNFVDGGTDDIIANLRQQRPRELALQILAVKHAQPLEELLF